MGREWKACRLDDDARTTIASDGEVHTCDLYGRIFLRTFEEIHVRQVSEHAMKVMKTDLRSLICWSMCVLWKRRESLTDAEIGSHFTGGDDTRRVWWCRDADRITGRGMASTVEAR